MFQDIPLGVIALTVWVYWATVLGMIINKRLRHGRHSGVIPRQRFERRLWIFVLPCIGLKLALPMLAATLHWSAISPGEWAGQQPMLSVRWAAAVVGVLCYLGSLFCWANLGRSWSLGVVPDQKTELVTSGVYGWVRHPIYALNIGLMLMVAVVCSTLVMAVVAAVHVVALNLKAGHEERHLENSFGTSYTEYCQRVGRFFPYLAPGGEQRRAA